MSAADEGALVRAAGGLVTREGENGLEVLVVHRPKYDDWSLPKGKAEAGEPDESTALREVEEETGVIATLGRELEPVEYVDRSGRPKRVRYWHMTVAAEGPFTPGDEIDARVWIPVAEVDRLLSYPHDRHLVSELERA